MVFRPCIDIHNGKIKQIVGSSLLDEGNQAKENFVAEQDGAFFAYFFNIIKQNSLRPKLIFDYLACIYFTFLL